EPRAPNVGVTPPRPKHPAAAPPTRRTGVRRAGGGGHSENLDPATTGRHYPTGKGTPAPAWRRPARASRGIRPSLLGNRQRRLRSARSSQQSSGEKTSSSRKRSSAKPH